MKYEFKALFGMGLVLGLAASQSLNAANADVANPDFIRERTSPIDMEDSDAVILEALNNTPDMHTKIVLLEAFGKIDTTTAIKAEALVVQGKGLEALSSMLQKKLSKRIYTALFSKKLG